MKTELSYHFLLLAVLVLVISGAANAANSDFNVFNGISKNSAMNLKAKNYAEDRIIVKFKESVKEEEIARINSGFSAIESYKSKARFRRLKLPKGRTVEEMVRLYKSSRDVEYAEPDYIATALMVPNDPYYSYQWNFYNPQYGGINAQEAWDISTGSNVVVAVVDTGVAYENYCGGSPLKCYYRAPDLANTVFVQGYDFANNDAHPNDDNSHGTHVTGTIAQSTNNNAGVAGIAFNAKIMPVKVLDKDGSGYYSWIADGIRYAADNGARVISLSLGGPQASATLEEAIAYAYSKNVTIVAAAGNDGLGGPASYPAAYNDYVIAVAATKYDEARSPYSTTGSYVDVAAPGGYTGADQNGDGYADGILQQTFNPSTKSTSSFGYYFFQGTSMATPHVSGLAALLIANGMTSPVDVRNAIEKTAEDKGAAGWDSEYGWGIIDAKAALQYQNACTDADQDTYCAEANDCNDNDASVNPAAPEALCNGIDNNCNNLIDENYASYSCGTGACAAQSICVNGAESCTQSSPLQEACNGIDDDCDGVADNNLIAPLCENQIGVCFGSAKACGGFLGWLPCNANNYGLNYEFNETKCSDSLDNDCDTLTDTNDPNCLFCLDNDNDGYGNNCALGSDCNDSDALINPGAPDSDCNGIDNNCNLLIDENYAVAQTSCGIGACYAAGQLLCQNGAETNTCTPGTPAAEICNGVDDDCDGSTDEDNVCVQKCWSASNTYLRRGVTNQYRKFCECAQGTYSYRSYSTTGGTRKAYYYTDSGNNENWATASLSQSSPVYRVRCSDNKFYNTNKDYFR